jgi:hypothetical protein
MTMAMDMFWVIFVLPLVASGIIALYWHRTAVTSDRYEKRYLAAMLAPLVLGIACLVAVAVLPESVRPNLLSFHSHLPGSAQAPLNMPAPTVQDFTEGLASLLLLVYGVTAAMKAATLIGAIRTLRRVIRSSSLQDVAGSRVSVTPQAPFPMVVDRRTIVLPAAFLDTFSLPELRLVILHEHAHQRRGDAAWFMVMAWLDVVLWFNPFVREQMRRCRLAAERDCDDAVVSSAPQERELYARTLVKTLRHTAGSALACVPAAISHRKSGDYRMRIRDIMEPERTPGKPRRLYAVLAAATLATIGLGQFAYAHVNHDTNASTSQRLEIQTGCTRDASGPSPCLFSAEDMSIDEARDVMTASGHVMLTEGARQIAADKVVLDTKTGRATFSGNVRVSANIAKPSS